MGKVDWGRLVTQGRAKAVGVSWTEEEAVAVAALAKATNQPFSSVAPYVRDGILTVEEYEKAAKKDEKDGAPLSRASRGELEAEATKRGIEFTDQTPNDTLAALIGKAPKKAAKAAPKKAK